MGAAHPSRGFSCEIEKESSDELEMFCATVACRWVYDNKSNLSKYDDSVVKLQPQEGVVPVRWAILQYEESLVVVFRGTNWKNILDIILDLSAVPIECPIDRTMVVHSGMWAATHMAHSSANANVSKTITEELTKKKTKEE